MLEGGGTGHWRSETLHEITCILYEEERGIFMHLNLQSKCRNKSNNLVKILNFLTLPSLPLLIPLMKAFLARGPGPSTVLPSSSGPQEAAQ